MRVLDGAKVIFRASVASTTAADGARRSVIWKTPAALIGAFRVCVTARDPDGRVRRGADCASVTVSDGQKPSVRALPSRGTAGTEITLQYLVFDNSRQTRDQVRVLQGKTVLAELDAGLTESVKGRRYGVRWLAPAAAVGTYTFCVVSTDAVGNTSIPSCAPVTVAAQR